MGKWADLYREKHGHGIDEEPVSAEPSIDPDAMKRVKDRLSLNILKRKFKLEKGRDLNPAEIQIIERGGKDMGPEDLRQHGDLLEWLGASREGIEKDLADMKSYKLEKPAAGATEDRGVTGMVTDEAKRVGGILARPVTELVKDKGFHPLNALKETALIPLETVSGIGDERDLLDTERGVVKEGAGRLLGALKEGHVAGSLNLFTSNPGDYAKSFGPAFWKQLTEGGNEQGAKLKEAMKGNKASLAKTPWYNPVNLAAEHANSVRFLPDYSSLVEGFADPLNLPFGAAAGKVAQSLGLITKVSKLGIESKLADDIGEGLAKTLGTNEEQWAAHLQDAGKAEAVRESIIQHSVKNAQWNDSWSEQVGKVFTNPNAVKALAKIPFVGESGALVIARTLRSLPIIGKRFGITGAEQGSVFRVAEGIKEFDAVGNPIFGAETRTGSGVLRRDVQATQKEWLSMRPEAQNATRWWSAQRQVEKSMFHAASDIEGYIHHFDDTGLLGSFKRLMLKNKKSAAAMFRTESGNFVEHAERAILRGGSADRTAKIYNDMVQDIAKNVSEPIPADGIPKGYVEVPSLQSTGTGGVAGQIAGGRMMKAELWDQLVRHQEAFKSINSAQQMVKALGNFYKSNLLTSPGTAVTNAVSGALQYAGKAINNTFRMLLTGDYKPVIGDIVAPFETIWKAAKGEYRSPTLWGGKSAIFSEMSKGVNPYARLQSALLTPFEAIENFWKRTLINSELRAKGLSGLSDAAVAGNTKLLGDLNRVVDRYAFNYDNVPGWLKKFRESWWGWTVMPFPTYGYKLARMYTHYGAAFNPFIKMEVTDRLARALTLGTLGGLGYSMAAGEARKHFQGMTTQVDTTGRSMVGMKGGKEQWLRTIKYPWANIGQGFRGVQDLISGGDEEGIKNTTGEFLTTGPLIEGIKVAAGIGDRWEANIPKGVRYGNIATSFVPMERLTQGLKAMEGGKRVLPTNFVETVANSIPFTGMQGKVQIDRVTKKPVMLDANLESMKFWLGLSMKEIDPKRYSIERQKKLKSILQAISEAKDESQLNGAVEKLESIDKDRLEGLSSAIKRRRLTLRGEQAELMDLIMKKEAKRTQAAILDSVGASR